MNLSALAALQAQHKLDGRTMFQGLPISVENRKGSVRKGKCEKGKPWSCWKTRMTAHYGYIRGIPGIDGDALDCFIGPNPDAKTAYIVTTLKAPEFKQDDEHKVMLGWDSAAAAKRALIENYGGDARHFGHMDAVPFDEFKQKVTKENFKPQKLTASKLELAMDTERFITAGGPGSGCRGPNCGRKAWVAQNGDVNVVGEHEEMTEPDEDLDDYMDRTGNARISEDNGYLSVNAVKPLSEDQRRAIAQMMKRNNTLIYDLGRGGEEDVKSARSGQARTMGEFLRAHDKFFTRTLTASKLELAMGLLAGGPGSGCNPNTGRCGRHEEVGDALNKLGWESKGGTAQSRTASSSVGKSTARSYLNKTMPLHKVSVRVGADGSVNWYHDASGIELKRGTGLESLKQHLSAKQLSAIGEPGVYEGGMAHIEPVPSFHPPSKRKKTPVPTDSPVEKDDKFLDVSKRKSRATKRMRDERTRRVAIPTQLPGGPTAVQHHTAMYLPFVTNQ